MKGIPILSIALVVFTSCKDDDFVTPNLLEFEEVAVLDAWNIHNAAGFLASEEMNSLFIASREPNPESQMLGERLLRYNVEDGTTEADFTDVTDFVTKEIHIIGDEIIVVGGQFINTYSIAFDTEPRTVEHGLFLSRFGSALYNGDIYIWGGDLNDVDSDKLKRWDRGSNTFVDVATLPARKAGAHGEVIGDKLYIFGGQEHWILEPPNDVVFVYDFVDDSFETLTLPVPVFRTFTEVYQDRIFIAGQIADNDPSTQDLDIFFAVFDPNNNTFEEIETSLSDRFFRTIHQMTIIGNDIYVLYGDATENLGTIELLKHTL